jgi:hypothetical protein
MSRPITEVTLADCRIYHETDKAYKVEYVDIIEWIPKSQIINFDGGQFGLHACITIPEWLAEEKGWS